MTNYYLPDGFTVEAQGEADSDWNGFPVPIIDSQQYYFLQLHLNKGHDEQQYSAQYVNDGKVTPGYYCDGLQWSIVQEDDKHECEDPCGLMTCPKFNKEANIWY